LLQFVAIGVTMLPYLDGHQTATFDVLDDRTALD
jgi:hypothetical protein